AMGAGRPGASPGRGRRGPVSTLHPLALPDRAAVRGGERGRSDAGDRRVAGRSRLNGVAKDGRDRTANRTGRTPECAAREQETGNIMRPLRILTWHVHGSYLYYLSRAAVELYLLSKPGRPPGYAGRYGHFPWGTNVHDMPVEALPGREFDAVLFQARRHYLED